MAPVQPAGAVLPTTYVSQTEPLIVISSCGVVVGEPVMQKYPAPQAAVVALAPGTVHPNPASQSVHSPSFSASSVAL